MTRVYVAGSSHELARARRWMDRLREEGFEITHDWVTEIENVGQANPPDATPQQRHDWAVNDLNRVADADILWLLAPAEGEGRGAYAELGTAYTLGREIVVSGPTKQSIFCALGEEFPDDEAAFAYILFLAKNWAEYLP